MAWAQKIFRLKGRSRGCHLVTDEIVRGVASELSQYEIGIANIFIQHTSASLTLNENCDPDVRLDMEDTLNRIVPEDLEDKGLYRHSDEGPDDFPAHVKSTLVGASLTVPIRAGRLALGTWQGIWMNEHRDRAGGRSIVVTLQGALHAETATEKSGKRARARLGAASTSKAASDAAREESTEDTGGPAATGGGGAPSGSSVRG